MIYITTLPAVLALAPLASIIPFAVWILNVQREKHDQLVPAFVVAFIENMFLPSYKNTHATNITVAPGIFGLVW